MEIDEFEGNSKNAEALQKLISKGPPLPVSLSKLSGSSRSVPFEKDFNLYNNSSEFKSPIKRSDENSSQALKKVGEAKKLEPYDWLVNLNDDALETFDVSNNEFQEMRKKEEESGVRMMNLGVVDDDGKKKNSSGGGSVAVGGNVQVATTKVESEVRFHRFSVPRPQDEYKIIMNNSNQPFEHVWFERSEDGSKSFHPLEKFSPLDFVDKNVENIVPIKPPPLENTPFMLVKEVNDLKVLAAKLRNVDEFAVDLEHNHYRSFQGLTCLMQISTRTEDFLVDTLKLRIHIGPYLREIFKDPTKRKVLHGSERDIVWLQRDFGIYICNMFDTGQASRVLKMEKFSLEYLLFHFCEVKANKEYQRADWRLRPIPEEMLRYAREDTHYLLYIYDVMRTMLISLTPESDESDPPLVEVYKRSYDLCMRLYEKELLRDDSYLHLYGVQNANLNCEQLACVHGLFEWRDSVSRAEDESTGYILPNKTLLELAKQIPLSPSKLKQVLKVLKVRHPYIERNLEVVVNVIKHSIQNAALFEPAVQHFKDLKEQRLARKLEEKSEACVEHGDGDLSSSFEKCLELKAI